MSRAETETDDTRRGPLDINGPRMYDAIAAGTHYTTLLELLLYMGLSMLPGVRGSAEL